MEKPYRGKKIEKDLNLTKDYTTKLKDGYKAAAGTISIPNALFFEMAHNMKADGSPGLKKTIEKLSKNFPDSVLSAKRGKDFMNDMGMEDKFASELMGFGLDVAVDPSTAAGAISKLTTGAPKFITNYPVQKAGEALREKGARALITRNIKQSDFDRGMVEPLVELIKKENLYKDLGDVEGLRKKLGGDVDLDDALKKVGILKSTKNEDGMIGEAGEAIRDLIRKAHEKNPSVKVNRQEMVNNLVSKQRTKNKTPGVEPVDLEKYEEKLKGVFNSQTEKRVKIAPKVKEEMPPSIPSDDVDSELFSLEDRIKTSKNAQASSVSGAKEKSQLVKEQAAAMANENKSRAATTSETDRRLEAVRKEREGIISSQTKERGAAEAKAASENKKMLS